MRSQLPHGRTPRLHAKRLRGTRKDTQSSSRLDFERSLPDRVGSLNENNLGAEGGKVIAAALPTSKITTLRCDLVPQIKDVLAFMSCVQLTPSEWKLICRRRAVTVIVMWC